MIGADFRQKKLKENSSRTKAATWNVVGRIEQAVSMYLEERKWKRAKNAHDFTNQ